MLNSMEFRIHESDLFCLPTFTRKPNSTEVWNPNEGTDVMQGMLTGLLGNISLLSYFAKKREAEAVVVQTLGVVSIYAVIVQLAMAGAMPLPHFTVTSIVVASGLVLNFLFYFGLLNSTLWNLWEDFITIGGVSAFPQVISIYWIYLLISLPLGQIMLFVLRVYISWGKRILGIKQN